MTRTQYKNEYIKNNYDRISLVIPKGEKQRIESIIKNKMTMNEYLYALICNDLSNDKSKLLEKKNVLPEEKQSILDKWQVPRKYHEMIEDLSYSKDDGYYIYLKKGYINDKTGSRTIIVSKTSELRMTINKSHKK